MFSTWCGTSDFLLKAYNTAFRYFWVIVQYGVDFRIINKRQSHWHNMHIQLFCGSRWNGLSDCVFFSEHHKSNLLNYCGANCGFFCDIQEEIPKTILCHLTSGPCLEFNICGFARTSSVTFGSYTLVLHLLLLRCNVSADHLVSTYLLAW